MTPPTSIDGTDISGATIDGQEVQEITVDGNNVFTAFEGAVVTRNEGGIVRAVNRTDGSTLWQIDFNEFPFSTRIGVDGGAVYIGNSDTGDLFAINKTDGTLRWQTNIGEQIGNFVVSDGDRVYLASGFNEYGVRAFDANDGSFLWFRPTNDETVEGYIGIGSDSVYFAARDENFRRVRKSDGSLVWRAQLARRGNTCDVLVDSDNVYHSFDGDKLFAFDKSDGSFAWTTSQRGDTEHTMVQDNDQIYTGERFTDALRTYRKSDGRRQWQFRGEVFNGVAVDNADVFAGAQSGAVYRLDKGNGNEVWKTSVPGDIDADIAVDPDAVYVVNREGTMFAFDKANGNEIWRNTISNANSSFNAMELVV